MKNINKMSKPLHENNYFKIYFKNPNYALSSTILRLQRPMNQESKAIFTKDLKKKNEEKLVEKDFSEKAFIPSEVKFTDYGIQVSL